MIQINILEDIINIIKQDKRHEIKICMDSLGVTIYLDDDPYDTYEEKYVIPVRYDVLYECCYIPHDEYVKHMSENTDCGIDKEEIDLIQKIMEYLENNRSSIHHYCNFLNREQREKINS